MKKIILTLAIICTLSLPIFVSAQGLKDAGTILDKAADSSKTGLSSDLTGTIATIIKGVLALVGTIFLILTIYAGVLWMTARGEEEPVKKAKDMIRASIIGLVIVMSAYAITAFVTSKLGGIGQPDTQSEPVGCCYATAASDRQCTPHENITESECARQYNDPRLFISNWVVGPCDPRGCPRIDL